MTQRVPEARMRSARRAGHVPHSNLLTASVLVTCLVSGIFISGLDDDITRYAARLWGKLGSRDTAGAGVWPSTATAGTLLVLFAVAWGLSATTGLLQTRFNLAPRIAARSSSTVGTFEPGLRRAGLAGVFVLLAVWIGVESVGWWASWSGETDPSVLAPAARRALAGAAAAVLLGMLSLGVADWLLVRRRWRKWLEVSPRWHREHARRRGVSPEVKSARRRLARQFARARRVPISLEIVLLTDPGTQRAVAIAWDPEALRTPHVSRLAAAERLAELVADARGTHGTVIRAPHLARRLSRFAPGTPVPRGLWTPLAQALAPYDIEGAMPT